MNSEEMKTYIKELEAEIELLKNQLHFVEEN
jgi:hypothetical protein